MHSQSVLGGSLQPPLNCRLKRCRNEAQQARMKNLMGPLPDALLRVTCLGSISIQLSVKHRTSVHIENKGLSMLWLIFCFT